MKEITVQPFIVIEPMETCKLVKSGSEYAGHGAFGESDFSSYDYVRINLKEEKVFNGMYILHNNEEVLGTCFDFNMANSILNIIDKKHILKKEKEERELYESLKLKYGKKKKK